MTTDNRPVPLTVSLFDAGSDIVRVEFQGKARKPVSRLTIASGILRDVYPRQVNQVNVRFGKTVRTMTFASGGLQTITLK